MTTTFNEKSSPSRYTDQLENALMAKAFADLGTDDEQDRKSLLSNWLMGTFNSESLHLKTPQTGRGILDWQPDGSKNHRLIWRSPTGLSCPLAQVYQQDDGTWASLVVAGVREDLIEALGAAEWAITRLTA